MFLLLNLGNQSLDQGDALLRLLRTVHEKFVVAMFLKFWGLLAKGAANTFTEL